MKNFKIIWLMSIMFFIQENIYSQYCEIEISFCEEINNQQEHNLFRVWFTIDNDTIYTPHIYGNIYYAPKYLCDARADTTKSIKIMLETYEYIYIFNTIDLTGGTSSLPYFGRFCVAKPRHKYYKKRGNFTLTSIIGSVGHVNPAGIGIKKTKDWKPFKAIKEPQ